MKPVNFKVWVKCFTYNHAPYIQDAMDGFCMQKTDFPYLCVIVDDASSDGEQDIIKEYLLNNFDLNNSTNSYNEETKDYSLVFARHKINTNCFYAVYFLKENFKSQKRSKLQIIKDEWKGSKYTAWCEGDDYWTDPLKLQKQNDFMESHPDCTLVFHNVLQYFQEKKEYKPWRILDNREYSAKEIIEKWTIPTCSAFYKSGITPKIPENKNFQYGDNVFWLTAAMHGKIYVISEIMGVYRRHNQGWTLKTNQKNKTLQQIKHFEAILESFSNFPKFKDVIPVIYHILFLRAIDLLILQKTEGNINKKSKSLFIKYLKKQSFSKSLIKDLFYFFKVFIIS